MAWSEYADWWDKQRKESEKILGDWVEDNPQWWAIGIAGTTATFMELGASMVDALRFGEGMAEGGVKGAGKDVLRLLVVVGPITKATTMLGRVAHTQMIHLAVKTKGVTGPCTFTAVNNALSIARAGKGRKLFLTAREAARGLGKSLSGLAKKGDKYKLAAWIDDLIPFLTGQGVRLRNLGSPKSVADVVSAAASNDGVVIFAMKWTDMANKTQYHSMIAVRTLRGVKFADYGGKFMNSLSELANRGGKWLAKDGYSIYTKADKGSAVLIKGMETLGALGRYAMKVFNGGSFLVMGATAIETPNGVDLAFPVAATAAIEKETHEPEVVKASYEAFKARKRGRPLRRLPSTVIKGCRNSPPPAQYLTGVQYRLNAAGFGAGPVDGIYGPKSKKAVNEFQKAYPELKVDGIPGPKTQAKLVEICGF